jgi:hypothetical protein
MGRTQVHSIYKHLWKSKCQPKHKVFFWLCLKNRLNTRGMILESYSCENCLWQREETLYHLFLRCNFTKACWNLIGITPPRLAHPEDAAKNLRQQLYVPFLWRSLFSWHGAFGKAVTNDFFKIKTPLFIIVLMNLVRSFDWLMVMLRARGKFDISIPS